MTRLARSLQAWNTPDFAAALKAELLALGPAGLPLSAATSLGGRVDDGALDVMVLGSRESDAGIEVDVGVFFVEVMGGCSCGDGPVEHNAWCRLRVAIDRASGAARIEVSGA